MVFWQKLVAFSLGIQRLASRTLVNIQIRRLKSTQFVRQQSKMAEEDGPLSFNSRSKTPYDKFSNFYEVKLKMPEGAFGSVEHYFQAMKFIEKNHRRFEINGDLGKRRIDSGSWKETVSRGRFIKSAGGKSGTQKYKLTLRRDGLNRERGKQKMKEALQKKFECDPFKSLLLETDKRKLVHIPMRGKTDYWTGRVDKTSGDISGENTMGQLLMEVRHKLQEDEKCAKGVKDINIVTIEDEDEKVCVKEKKAGDDMEDNRGDDDIKDENRSDEGIKDKNRGDDEIKDENKGDNDIKDENKGDDDIEDDGLKGDDVKTTSKPKGNLASKGAKRKHESDDRQVEDLNQEVSVGPKIKRKKTEKML